MKFCVFVVLKLLWLNCEILGFFVIIEVRVVFKYLVKLIENEYKEIKGIIFYCIIDFCRDINIYLD